MQQGTCFNRKQLKATLTALGWRALGSFLERCLAGPDGCASGSIPGRPGDWSSKITDVRRRLSTARELCTSSRLLKEKPDGLPQPINPTCIFLTRSHQRECPALGMFIWLSMANHSCYTAHVTSFHVGQQTVPLSLCAVQHHKAAFTR